MARKKTETTETIVAFKGFDKDLVCNPTGDNPFAYAVGQTYKHDGAVVACGSGFHVCENPMDVLGYYPLVADDGSRNRFCKVTVGGKIERHTGDSKIAAGQITVEAELLLPEFIKTIVNWFIGQVGKGDGVQAASGDYAQLAASGNYAQLAASGYSAKLAASGNYAQLAASGYSAKLAASGYSAKLAASGNSAKLAASGNYAQLAASGDSAQLAASGDSAQLAASGDSAQLAASGYSAKLAASGYSAKLAASGNYAKLEVTGAKSAAAAVGPGSTIKATAGAPISICEYDSDGEPIGFATGIAGRDGVPADVWLKASGGNLVEA